METNLTEGTIVKVDECYLNDEVTQGVDTSSIATIFREPTDDEELVGIIYEGGTLDYVPQYILEVVNVKGLERYGSWYHIDNTGLLWQKPMAKNDSDLPAFSPDDLEWAVVCSTAFSPDELSEFDSAMEELFGEKYKGIDVMTIN